MSIRKTEIDNVSVRTNIVFASGHDIHQLCVIWTAVGYVDQAEVCTDKLLTQLGMGERTIKCITHELVREYIQCN